MRRQDGNDDEGFEERASREVLGAQLDAYRESLDPTNAPPCGTCGGGGRVLVDRFAYVTRDMASDADEPGMEGMQMHDGQEWVDCPECNGPPVPESRPSDLDDLDLPF